MLQSVTCLQSQIPRFYRSVIDKISLPLKVNALFVAYRPLIIALVGSIFVGMAWKFYSRTITPLFGKVDQAILHRSIGPIEADFNALNENYLEVKKQVANLKVLTIKDGLQELFIAILKALPPFDSKEKFIEKKGQVISILSIVHGTDLTDEKIRRIRTKRILTEATEKQLQTAIDTPSLNGFTWMMNFLVENHANTPSIDLLKIEAIHEAFSLISIVPQENADFICATLLLIHKIFVLQNELENFSIKNGPFFQEQDKHPERKPFLGRLEKMTPEIIRGMQQNLKKYQEELSAFMGPLTFQTTHFL